MSRIIIGICLLIAVAIVLSWMIVALAPVIAGGLLAWLVCRLAGIEDEPEQDRPMINVTPIKPVEFESEFSLKRKY